MKISAIIPTRGDVDMKPVVEHLRQYQEIDDIQVIVGNTVFNRYKAVEYARHDVVYTQDDDCITDIRPLIDAYEPGVIVNAMTEDHAQFYRGAVTLVGFGAIFDKALVSTLDSWEKDELFLRECDRVFTALHPHKSIFLPIQHREFASNPNRMWRQPGHGNSLAAIRNRIQAKLGIAA